MARNQLRNVREKLDGRSAAPPSCYGTTLALDDVRIVRDELAHPGRWDEPGPVRAYEEAFAAWTDILCARAFMGGRVALSACIYALGLQPGDEVVVPAYTCVVVPNAFRFAGVAVRYCDIELETYGPDVDSLAEALTSRTRAIVLQHLYGLVARDTESILALARKNDLAVIEDCAHSAGARLHGRHVGSLGDVAFYSSEESKAFCTGQGGIAVTNRAELASRIEEYSSRADLPSPGRTDGVLRAILFRYYHEVAPYRAWTRDIATLCYGRDLPSSTTAEELSGRQPSHYGQRLPAPLARVGLRQLSKLDELNRRRRAAAKFWREGCERRGWPVPHELRRSEPIYLRFPTRLTASEKADRGWARREFGVALGAWFKSQLHPAAGVVSPSAVNATLAVATCVNFPTLQALPQAKRFAACSPGTSPEETRDA